MDKSLTPLVLVSPEDQPRVLAHFVNDQRLCLSPAVGRKEHGMPRYEVSRGVDFDRNEV